jgi:hypothetical protein
MGLRSRRAPCGVDRAYGVPATWADLLHQHGFREINARIEPAPDADHVGTLIVAVPHINWRTTLNTDDAPRCGDHAAGGHPGTT